MSFNNMWFLDSAPSEWKDIWNNLMKEAQRVYIEAKDNMIMYQYCLLYTSPSPRDLSTSRMPSSA